VVTQALIPVENAVVAPNAPKIEVAVVLKKSASA
jgi:hypothetical protein